MTDSNLKIFIGGVPRNVNDEEFSQFFQSFGSIKTCTLMRDGMGMSRGFGFVVCDDLSTYDQIFRTQLLLKGKRLEQKKAVPQGQVAETSESNVKLFIGGLAPQIDKIQLRDFFSKFGEVCDTVVMKDSATGKSRGFGFLTFLRESSAEEVLKDPHFELGGRMVQCKRAQPRGAGRGTPFTSVSLYPRPSIPVYGVRYESSPPQHPIAPPQHPVAPLMTGYGQPAFQGDVGGAPAVEYPQAYGGSATDYREGYGSVQMLEPQQGIQQPQSQPPMLQAASYIPAVQSYTSSKDVQSSGTYSSQERYRPY